MHTSNEGMGLGGNRVDKGGLGIKGGWG